MIHHQILKFIYVLMKKLLFYQVMKYFLCIGMKIQIFGQKKILKKKILSN